MTPEEQREPIATNAAPDWAKQYVYVTATLNSQTFDTFKIETHKASYDCQYHYGTIIEDKQRPPEWKVYASFTKIGSAIFTFPGDWARTRVFQFIDSVDKAFE